MKNKIINRLKVIKGNRRAGFTLIEIMFAVAIITILTGIMVPNFNAMINKMNVEKYSANMISIHTAADLAHQTDEELSEAKLRKYSKILNVRVGEDPVSMFYTVSKDIDSGTIYVRYQDQRGRVYKYDSIMSEDWYDGINGDDSGEALYTKEEIDNLVNEGYIPIATVDELDNLRTATSQAFGEGTKWQGEYTPGLDKKYIQVADIDLSGITNFEPIGTTDTANSFTGTYDGGGYTISNLKIDKGSNNFAGLFGRVEGATLKNIGLEDVSVTGGRYTGGLVGHQDRSSVSNSYATGQVTGGEFNTGGLVGYQNESSVTNSYATGTVTGGFNTGGLVGSQMSGSSTTNSYATGTVTGGDSTGGLVGSQSKSYTTNSYATGQVTGVSLTGGLVGYNDRSSTANSYWDTQTTGQTAVYDAGTGKTTAEMKNKDTYVGWDFTNIWEITNGQYPTLR